jgi:Cu+-exporting ATPase
LIICAVLTAPLLAHMFLPWPLLHNPVFQLLLATPIFAIGCYVFLPPSVRSLRHGMPSMDVLIMLGASAAYGYSLYGLITLGAGGAHHYLFFETAASIITLVMAGNWLEHTTVRATTSSIDALARLQPPMARLVMTDSLGKESFTIIESKYLRTGDIVIVNTGDTIPADGEVTTGEARVDEQIITGESTPASKGPGSGVVGGTILEQGSLRVRTTAVGNASVVSGIVKAVREAQAARPPIQRLADKISALFVPTVLGISLLTLLLNIWVGHLGFAPSMMRAIAVLVVACPCAMGLATPAAIAVGLGRAARNGMLIKGADTLELLQTVKTIVFDKTGTLTTGKLHIDQFIAIDLDDIDFQAHVASLERFSSHPIAMSIVAQWANAGNIAFQNVEELKGKGMQATDQQGQLWQLGSASWLAHALPPGGSPDLVLLKDGHYQGGLSLTDEPRPDALETIATLRNRGYHTVMLSGDRAEKCNALAASLGITEVYSQQSPLQKAEVLNRLKHIAPTAMVGDGINDAPALASATVGVSLSQASDIALQSASLVLSSGHLSSLPAALRLGTFTTTTIRQNLGWAFFYNLVAIPVAATGHLEPAFGAGIMALSDLVLVLNSLRLGFRRIYKKD